MKNTLLATLVAFALSIPASAQRTRGLEQIAYTLAGSYTSAEQAKSDISYFEIELEMVRIWRKRKDGAWFYVEQATAANKAKPYRQRVYHVQEINDSTYTSDIHTIKGGEALFGIYNDPVALEAINPDSLGLLDGCTITLQRRGSVYVGSTRGRDCSNAWGKAAYATSEVSVFTDRMVSWDRGYDAKGVQVWGAEKGGYVFIKRKR